MIKGWHTRFWGKTGYRNIKEFKQALLHKLSTRPDSKIKNTLSHWQESHFDSHDIFRAVIQHIEVTARQNPAPLVSSAAALLFSARHIFSYAPDASRAAQALMGFRLKRFGREVIAVHQGGELFDSLLTLQKNDVLVLLP